MDWFKKHVDTIAVLSAIFASFLWMNSKFNEFEKDITIIKTILIVKNIMPSELAKYEVK